MSEYEIPEIDLRVADLEPFSAEREAAIFEANLAAQYLSLIETDVVEGISPVSALYAAVSWVRDARDALQKTD